jgi:hypothetical protein
VFRKSTSTCIASWPVKLTSFVFCVGSLFYSCKDPKRVSLERQVLENASGIAFVDTFSIKVETICIDTPSTKNQAHLLVGSYTDALLGTIQSEAYAQLSFSGFDTLKMSRIDSAVLSIDYDFVLGDDLTKPISFTLQEVKEKIDSTASYNRLSILQKENNPLETITLNYNTNKTYSAKSASLKTLMEKYLGFSENDFKDAFKGIALMAPNPSFAIGIKSGSKSGFNIKLYGLANPTDIFSTTYTLDISEKSQRFNKVSYNATGKPFANLGSTSNTQNMAVLNDVLGLGAKISFPGLSNFLQSIKTDYNILEAYLLLPSSPKFSQSVDSPFPILSLIECDATGNALKNTDGSFKLVQAETQTTKGSNMTAGSLYSTGNELYLGYDNQNARFKYPFSLYAKEIQKGGKPNNPFVLSLSSLYFTKTESSIGYSFHDQTKGGIKLVVYYNKNTF